MISETELTLGQALVAANLMSAKDLDAAVRDVESEKTSNLIIQLLKKEFLSFKIFQKFLTQNYKMRTTILAEREIPLDLAEKIGWEMIESRHILPIMMKTVENSQKLAVGMVNPLDEATITEVQNITGAEITPLLVSLSDFQEAYAKSQARMNTTKMGNHTAIATYEEQLHRLELLNNAHEVISKEGGVLQTPHAALPTIRPIQPAPVPMTEYFAGNVKKFKEEVIVKLELDNFEASALEKESYNAGELFDELNKMKKSTLERNFETLDANAKFNALANSLIRQGLVGKLDILVAGSVARVFGETKN